MLSLEDCIAFSGLTRDQLDAVACFKHLPPVIAAEWAETMLDTPGGCDELDWILAEEAGVARRRHLPCAGAWCTAAKRFHEQMRAGQG